LTDQAQRKVMLHRSLKCTHARANAPEGLRGAGDTNQETTAMSRSEIDASEVDRAFALMLAQVQGSELRAALAAVGSPLTPEQSPAVERALRDAAYTLLTAVRQARDSIAAQRFVEAATSLIPPDWPAPQMSDVLAHELTAERAQQR
jgi:hypothetical protein